MSDRRVLAARTARFVIRASSFVILSSFVIADDPASDPDRTTRLNVVKAKFAEWTLTKADNSNSPLKPLPDPVLRYSNPTRNSLSDGMLFLWLDGGRPIAGCAYSVRGPESPPKVAREFTSLFAMPLHCERSGSPAWKPKQGGLVDQPVPGSTVPKDKPAARLTEMREIARRFEADFFKGEVPTQLRLMPQPIYRFHDEAAEIIDGGLFGFVEANDPELLLMLEARKGSPAADAEWRYTLARMTSLRLSVRIDGKEVFAPTAYWKFPRSPEDPYLEAFDGPYRPEDAATVSGVDGKPEKPFIGK